MLFDIKVTPARLSWHPPVPPSFPTPFRTRNSKVRNSILLPGATILGVEHVGLQNGKVVMSGCRLLCQHLCRGSPTRSRTTGVPRGKEGGGRHTCRRPPAVWPGLGTGML